MMIHRAAHDAGVAMGMVADDYTCAVRGPLMSDNRVTTAPADFFCKFTSTSHRNIMNISMYNVSIPVLIKMLGNLDAILDKAIAHAAARKIDEAAFVDARLFPDMFPFARQIRIATDMAKGAGARLAGIEIPKFEDNEKTLPELK